MRPSRVIRSATQLLGRHRSQQRVARAAGPLPCLGIVDCPASRAVLHVLYSVTNFWTPVTPLRWCRTRRRGRSPCPLPPSERDRHAVDRILEDVRRALDVEAGDSDQRVFRLAAFIEVHDAVRIVRQHREAAVATAGGDLDRVVLACLRRREHQARAERARATTSPARSCCRSSALIALRMSASVASVCLISTSKVSSSTLIVSVP